MAVRDIKIRYTQTILGWLWMFINPLVNLVILVIVFSKIINLEVEGQDYTVFVITGLMAWNYFSTVVADVGNIIMNSRGLIQKVFFPKITIILSRLVVGGVELLATVLILIVIMIYKSQPPSFNIVYILLPLLLTTFLTLGISLWVGAFVYRFRDIVHIVPIVLRILMFLSPIGYSIVGKDEVWYKFNPLVSCIELYRWCILPHYVVAQPILPGVLIVLFLVGSGFYLFARMEQTIADHL